jgi:hypothetical protein
VSETIVALPGVGHACGHNLIAIAGIAVACALKAALTTWDIPGRIELLGTPGIFDFILHCRAQLKCVQRRKEDAVRISFLKRELTRIWTYVLCSSRHG